MAQARRPDGRHLVLILLKPPWALSGVLMAGASFPTSTIVRYERIVTGKPTQYHDQPGRN